MSSHPTDFSGSVHDAIRKAIQASVPDALVQVDGGGGHYTISVAAPAFAGKSMLESQRMVYAAIAHLMSGDRAPVHAIDSLKTKVSPPQPA
jgi:acid stress-induced BolA-like protein IbaG/YrbA